MWIIKVVDREGNVIHESMPKEKPELLYDFVTLMKPSIFGNANFKIEILHESWKN